jgi:hypothetical protein
MFSLNPFTGIARWLDEHEESFIATDFATQLLRAVAAALCPEASPSRRTLLLFSRQMLAVSLQ